MCPSVIIFKTVQNLIIENIKSVNYGRFIEQN